MPISEQFKKSQNAQTYPDQFFVASFFDGKVIDFYNAEAIESTLFKTFAILAIFISCLGLQGLVSFMVVQKTKEVGIRKVLGPPFRVSSTYSQKNLYCLSVLHSL